MALSCAADLLGIIHGQRDAKSDASSLWLLVAQRQQRIKAVEADTLNTMVNPLKRCVSLFPDACILSHHCARAKALLPAIIWPKFHLSLRGAGRLFPGGHREQVLTGVCIRRRAQMTLYHCLRPSHHLRRAYTSSPGSSSSSTPLSTSP